MEDTYGIQSRIGSIIVVERWYCCRGSPVFSDRNIQMMFSVNSSKQSRRRSRYNTYNKSLPIVVYGGSCFEIMIDLVVRICVSCFR